MFKKFKWVLLAIFVVLPSSALALTAHNDNFVVLEKDQVINRNYYAAGNTVEINGTVNGDVFVAGNTIVIDSENINGDIFAAGSNITIKGKINGSLRLAGTNIDFIGEVTKNAMVAGQNFRVDADSKLAGHLTFWGQALNVAGQVGSLEGAFSSLRLSGTVNNDADIYLTQPVKDAINISDDAVINGTLYYQALKKVEINSKAAIGNVSFNEIIKKTKEDKSSARAFGLLIKFFGMLTLGMVILYMWPSVFATAYQRVYKKPLASFFQGFGLLLLTPIFCILLAITFIGIPIAIVLMVLWGLAMYFACIFAAWILGSFVKHKFLAKYKWSNLFVLAFGILLYILIAKLPYLGPLVIAILYLMAWGSIYSLFKNSKEIK
ncbi:MAG: hypothetical protein WCS88_02020 [Patescibacteria group bacterium]|jgi:cytoskeletal protein CcmA (bactofilin family)